MISHALPVSPYFAMTPFSTSDNARADPVRLFRVLAFMMFGVAVMAFTADAWAAKLYKWVDENGVVHYSQLPPSSAPDPTDRRASPPSRFPTPEEYCAEAGAYGAKLASQPDPLRVDDAVRGAPTALRLNAAAIVDRVVLLRSSGASPGAIRARVEQSCLAGKFRAGVRLSEAASANAPARPTAEKGESRGRASGRDSAGSRVGTAWPVGGRYVVTNQHVIGERDNAVVMRTDGVRIKARVVFRDRENDLALMAVESPDKLPPSLSVAAGLASLGERVFTVGYPHVDLMGVEPKLTQGIVNATTGLRDDPRFYQISVAVQKGNSGGPLLNMRGEVVGVVTAKLNAFALMAVKGELLQDVSFAIKGDRLRGFLTRALRTPNPPADIQPRDGADLGELAGVVRDSVLLLVSD